MANKSIKNDITFNNVVDENKELKKELHKLRKLEAGWFGKHKNYIKKEIIIRNNHYHEEIEKITSELTILTEKYNNLENERNSLFSRNESLESELFALK